jgi:hypothetical protein
MFDEIIYLRRPEGLYMLRRIVSAQPANPL